MDLHEKLLAQGRCCMTRRRRILGSAYALAGLALVIVGVNTGCSQQVRTLAHGQVVTAPQRGVAYRCLP